MPIIKSMIDKLESPEDELLDPAAKQRKRTSFGIKPISGSTGIEPLEGREDMA